MAQYKKYGKSTKLVYGLFSLAVLELILLAVLGAALLSGRSAPAAEEVPPPAAGDRPDSQDGRDTAVPAAAPAAVPEPENPAEKEKPAGERSAWEILSEARLITHGMGEVDGVTTLNCLEGFQAQYAQGVRAFEVDLRLTADQQVVLRHDWRAGWQSGVSEVSIPTLKEFLSRPILKQYTPLSFRDLLLLMEEYPDICVITDTKFTDAEIVTLQFEAMLRDAEELGLSYLFDRMIVQVYDSLMFKVVDNVHHFNHYIYTLYQDSFSTTEAAFREKAAFCAENGIGGITMWDRWWRTAFAPIAAEYGVEVYTHTVNDPDRARSLLDSGVAGIYTDSLIPAVLEPSGEAPEDAEAASQAEEKSPAEGEP